MTAVTGTTRADDALLAEKVLGWIPPQPDQSPKVAGMWNTGDHEYTPARNVPRFGTEAGAMRALMVAFARKGISVGVRFNLYSRKWAAEIIGHAGRSGHAFADTPEAAVKAAALESLVASA